MSDTLRLHYAPDNASLCVRLALEECGMTYQTALVDRSIQAQRSAAYLALNPNGLIPVLETPNGPMFETGAILLWLADKDHRLLPAPDAPGRAHAIQWMFWLSGTLHQTLRVLFYPAQFTDDATDTFQNKTRQRLVAQFDLLAGASTTPWLESDDATAQGCYLAPMLRWCALYGGSTDWFDLTKWPRLNDFAMRMEQRPAAITAAKAEGLGPTPFSTPRPCNPPEGSAI